MMVNYIMLIIQDIVCKEIGIRLHSTHRHNPMKEQQSK